MQKTVAQILDEVAPDRVIRDSLSRDFLTWFQVKIADTKLIPSVVHPLFR